jgi:hypothetical protein
LEGYLERRQEDGDDRSTGADDEPFSADTFFGEDSPDVWRPDALQATVDFLEEHADELAVELLEDDPLERLNGPDNPTLVPLQARERLEMGLRALGFDVRRWEALDALYDGVDVDPVTELLDTSNPVVRARKAGQ